MDELVSAYKRHPLPPDRERERITLAERAGRKAGLVVLPEIRKPAFQPEAWRLLLSIP